MIFDSYSKPERGKLGYIPQKLGLITHETVYFNVLEGAICHESLLRSITGFHEEKVIDNSGVNIGNTKNEEKD